MPEQTELQRSLRWWDAANVVVGIVIGAGIFVTPQDLAKAMPSAEGMIAAWLVAGTLVFCGALAFAELSTMYSATGGIYIYLREAFGREVAFSSGWIHLFTLLSGGTAYIAAGFGGYLSSVTPAIAGYERWVAVALILSLSALNAWSMRATVRLQNWANLAKLAALLALITGAFFASPNGGAADSATSGAGNFAVAMAVCFFCFEGWSYAGFVAGEMKKPERDLPRAFAVSFLVILALYLLVTLAYLRVMPVATLQGSAQAGKDLAARTLGPAGAMVVTGTILLAIIGSVNGLGIAASRLYMAQARDGLFLPGLGELHPRLNTPLRAIVVHAVMSCVYLLVGSLANVLQMAIFSAWLYYFLAVVGLMWLRRKAPERARPFRMWGYPVTPLLFLAGSGQFLAGLVLQNPGPPLFVLALVGFSIPVARRLGQSKSARPVSEVA
jgi:APA family basic amino acid/polyamine antiporter